MLSAVALIYSSPPPPLVTHTRAPQMPGKGMTCWDKRELCDLNCVFATTHGGTDKLESCSTGCMEDQAACTDSDETLTYMSVRFFSFFFLSDT